MTTLEYVIRYPWDYSLLGLYDKNVLKILATV